MTPEPVLYQAFWFALGYVGALVALRIIAAMLCAFYEWRLRQIFKKMTPEQKVAVLCRKMVEALRKNRQHERTNY